MADLDDFFAKKDRRRNKGGAKTEEKKETKERPRPREGEEPRTGEEEEWKEYEETVKDYTGLKIQVLQGGAPGTGAESNSGVEEAVSQEQGKTKGPWNKPELPEAPEPAPAVSEPPAPRSSAPYKPPPARRTDAPVYAPLNKRQHNAPDINNSDFFPSLGASGKPRGGGWSTAGGAGAGAAGARHTAQRRPLALDNRFTSLQDDS